MVLWCGDALELPIALRVRSAGSINSTPRADGEAGRGNARHLRYEFRRTISAWSDFRSSVFGAGSIS